jgi:hypothetical protein
VNVVHHHLVVIDPRSAQHQSRDGLHQLRRPLVTSRPARPSRRRRPQSLHLCISRCRSFTRLPASTSIVSHLQHQSSSSSIRSSSSFATSTADPYLGGYVQYFGEHCPRLLLQLSSAQEFVYRSQVKARWSGRVPALQNPGTDHTNSRKKPRQAVPPRACKSPTRVDSIAYGEASQSTRWYLEHGVHSSASSIIFSHI